VLDRLLYAVLPYAAVFLFAVVPLVRHLATSARRAALAAERAAARRLYGGTPAWRWSLVLLALCHPAWFALAGRGRAWLEAVEGAGFVAGLAALAGLGLLLGERRTGSGGVEAHGDTAGSLLLLLAVLGIASGLTLAFQYGPGSSWYAVTLVPYIASLARLRPDVMLAAGLPPLAKLHLLGGFAALAVLPFTPLGATLVAAPLAALGRRLRPAAPAGASLPPGPGGEAA
jgi:nitrate reductase gamma subunit